MRLLGRTKVFNDLYVLVARAHSVAHIERQLGFDFNLGDVRVRQSLQCVLKVVDRAAYRVHTGCQCRKIYH